MPEHSYTIKNREDQLHLSIMDGTRAVLRLEDEHAGPGQVGSMRLNRNNLLELIQAASIILAELVNNSPGDADI